MRRLQFSTRTAFVAMTLVALYLASSRLYRNWFESKYSSYVVSKTLSGLENGMSFERVRAAFSTATQLEPSDLVDLGPTQVGKVRHGDSFEYTSHSLIAMLKGIFNQMPPGDKLYHFTNWTGGGAFLQFRSGMLINFNPALHQPTVQTFLINDEPFPNAAFRFGILPYFIPIAIMLLWIERLVRRQKRRTPFFPVSH